MTTYEDIIHNHGATMNQHGEAITYKTGYQVSVRDMLVVDLASFTQDHVRQVMEAVRKQYKGCQAGFWVCDGCVFCDISKHVTSRERAFELGRQYHQLSVWDWKRQVEWWMC